MTLLPIFLVTAVLALAVTVGFMLRLLVQMRGRLAEATERRLGDADLDALSQHIAETLGSTLDPRLAALTRQVEDLHADFDWVVGEAVIQSAISVARTGQPTSAPAPAAKDRAPLSAEDVRMLRSMRRH